MGTTEGAIAEFAELIRGFEPIGQLDRHAAQDLIERGAVIRVDAGGLLFRQGDQDPYIYWLIDGDIELSDGKTDPERLSPISAQALYPIAPGRPRTYSARAGAETVCFRLDRSLLDDALREHARDSAHRLEVSEMDENGQYQSEGDDAADAAA